jgi:hypothetical protein
MLHLALLPGGDAPGAVERFIARERNLGVAARLESRFLLWQATGERSHLDEAVRLLRHLRDHAPEQDRDTMVARVPLYRDIVAAGAEL